MGVCHFESGVTLALKGFFFLKKGLELEEHMTLGSDRGWEEDGEEEKIPI